LKVTLGRPRPRQSHRYMALGLGCSVKSHIEALITDIANRINRPTLLYKLFSVKFARHNIRRNTNKYPRHRRGLINKLSWTLLWSMRRDMDKKKLSRAHSISCARDIFFSMSLFEIRTISVSFSDSLWSADHRFNLKTSTSTLPQPSTVSEFDPKI